MRVRWEGPENHAEAECEFEGCGGTGFVVLIDYDGPGLHDEDNCPCACHWLPRGGKKWSEVRREVTPERRERIDAIKRELEEAERRLAEAIG